MQALLGLQILMAILIVMIIMFLLRQRRVAKFEKRFAPFTLKSVTNEDLSLGDSFQSNLVKMVKKLTNIMKHLPFYKAKLEVKNSTLTKEDFITIKIILSVGVLVLVFILDLFNFLNMKLVLYLLLVILTFLITNIVLAIYNYNYLKKLDKALNFLVKEFYDLVNLGETPKKVVEIIVKDNPFIAPFLQDFQPNTYGDIINKLYEMTKSEVLKPLLLFQNFDLKKSYYYYELNALELEKYKENQAIIKIILTVLSYILLAIPLVIIVLLFIFKPMFFKPFFSSLYGMLNLLFLVLLYLLYYLIIKYLVGVS